ncbi:MAG: glycosyltransferase [Anaerolineae bacterium]|jgi:glycosyltransferase involved in cell wall biosynthesis|nr:glycosyltransferase [Anaerolineae bacterium]MDH7475151.1 glycosyltransferase [Anaerolineae bacterium]
MTPPLCSVIIPAYNSEATIRACLNSVLHQETDAPYEIIVVDSSQDSTPDLVREHFPTVTLIHFPRRTDPGTARNAGVKRAKGNLLVFIDSDCIAEPGWLQGMWAAHQNGDWRVVGGAVVNGNPESLVSWAGYIKEFSEYLPQAQAGLVHSLPTCNISYRREIFERYGGYDGSYYPQEDYLFHWQLIRGGEKIFFEPSIQVRHFHRARLGDYLRHSRRFGVVTARVLKITDLPGAFFSRRPWLAPLFIPFLPFIKFTRTCARVLRISPGMLLRRPLVFFLLFLGMLYWGIGFVEGVYTKQADRDGGLASAQPTFDRVVG